MSFFGAGAIRSGRSRPPGFAPWKPRKVGVLGAGMMGAGIAHANAARGIACVLKDVSLEKAEAGLAAIDKITAPQVAKGRHATPQPRRSLLAPDHADRRRGRPRRLRPDHRGGVRAARR